MQMKFHGKPEHRQTNEALNNIEGRSEQEQAQEKQKKQWQNERPKITQNPSNKEMSKNHGKTKKNKNEPKKNQKNQWENQKNQ